MEYICEYLCPGTQYKVRVACTSKGGVSDFSEVCHICTEPIPPGQCAPPRPHGKPKANSLHLKWGWPESDGGSPVTEFEIDMTSPDNKTKGVYRGRETECIVSSLLPGKKSSILNKQHVYMFTFSIQIISTKMIFSCHNQSQF